MTKIPFQPIALFLGIPALVACNALAPATPASQSVSPNTTVNPIADNSNPEQVHAGITEVAFGSGASVDPGRKSTVTPADGSQSMEVTGPNPEIPSGPAENSSASVHPAVAAPPVFTPEEDLSGKTALYYRASFGSETETLKTVITDVRGDGNKGVANVSWTTGSKGIVRYIPETGQVDVIKIISSPSWAKSSIYPLTIDQRLFALRDWGSDWAIDNKKFTIDELDPVTGITLSSTDITAEWFTIVGDHVYYKSEVDDFWGTPRGGQIRTKRLGTPSAEIELSSQDARWNSVGGQLVSLHDGKVRVHDRATGEVRSVNGTTPALLEQAWPQAGTVFYADDAVYWAWDNDIANELEIIRRPLDGEPHRLLTLQLEGWEQGLVIDESQGQVMIAVTQQAPPKGIAITQVFLMDLDSGDVQEVPVDQHIPSASLRAGGGLQILTLP